MFLKKRFFIFFMSSVFISSNAFAEKINTSDCTYKGKPLYGKVKIVEHFPDFKIKVVDSFEDVKVQYVENFPDKCGQWQIVEHFPDFKVQFVDHFPDFKIRTVESNSGIR